MIERLTKAQEWMLKNPEPTDKQWHTFGGKLKQMYEVEGAPKMLDVIADVLIYDPQKPWAYVITRIDAIIDDLKCMNVTEKKVDKSL